MTPNAIEALPLETPNVNAPIGSASSKDPKEGLDAFAAESSPHVKPDRRTRFNVHPSMAAAAIAVIGIAAGVGGTLAYQQRFGGTSRSASLTIETVPIGLEVSIDGQSRGRTPLTLTLPPRDYEAVVGSGSDRRLVKASLAAGAAIVQRLELTASPGPAAPTYGILRIDTIPPALAIKVDGIDRGVSPLMLLNVTPGEHDVALANGRESLHRKVTVYRGERLSLLLTAPGAAQSSVSAGWVSVDASVPLQIREDGKLLGSTESDRLLIAAGNHTLDLVNPELGFSQRLTVSVTAGKVSELRVKVPDGTLSLNAQPWAQVFVDGVRVGETPIGNLVRPIGRHEVVFRHPELGERRETVMVTTLQPARLGVDLRRKSQ